MQSLLYLYIIIYYYYYHIYIIIIHFLYILLFFFFPIQRINVDKRVDVNIFIPERGGSPPSLPFVEVRIFFLGGSP
jgi:hypothetical protein